MTLTAGLFYIHVYNTDTISKTVVNLPSVNEQKTAALVSLL